MACISCKAQVPSGDTICSRCIRKVDVLQSEVDSTLTQWRDRTKNEWRVIFSFVGLLAAAVFHTQTADFNPWLQIGFSLGIVLLFIAVWVFRHGVKKRNEEVSGRLKNIGDELRETVGAAKYEVVPEWKDWVYNGQIFFLGIIAATAILAVCVQPSRMGPAERFIASEALKPFLALDTKSGTLCWTVIKDSEAFINVSQKTLFKDLPTCNGLEKTD